MGVLRFWSIRAASKAWVFWLLVPFNWLCCCKATAVAAAAKFCCWCWALRRLTRAADDDDDDETDDDNDGIDVDVTVDIVDDVNGDNDDLFWFKIKLFPDKLLECKLGKWHSPFKVWLLTIPEPDIAATAAAAEIAAATTLLLVPTDVPVIRGLEAKVLV